MKILLATDGSDSARDAVDLLIRFPFPKNSSVTVMAVIDIKNLDMVEPYGLDADHYRILQETEQTIHEEREQLLAAESARLRDAGWSDSTEIRKGDPAEEIIQAAEELQADLVVLGSHGTGEIKHYMLGNVSDRVLRHACCSVLVVKPSPKQSMPAESADQALPWRILMSYDGSEPAKKAIRLCASLPLDDNAEVSVVSVMPMVHMYRQDIRQQMNTIWQQQKHARKEALKSAVTALQWSTPHVSSTLLESADVSQAILEIAEKDAIDLVVLGYKGRSAVKRFLLGSITSRIVHHAPCSVMVVRN
ncbi:MAG: universal stress protein [Halobacteria archaeon]|nr:universal stress protein [Halobacteria archaeon]